MIFKYSSVVYALFGDEAPSAILENNMVLSDLFKRKGGQGKEVGVFEDMK